ncbi:MAG: TonB-dependent receptor [Tepidisphaeraceae bacterium]
MELPKAQNGPTAVAPEIVVRGRDEDLVGVADTSNQGYIGHDEIESRPLLRPAEVLEAIPGLVITQHSGDGKANQYFLRGFQLDHGTDFAVSLDGVPQNLPTHAHGQGYLDLNDLIPELIDNIDFRKGPYYGEVGDFSAAGSADIKYVDTLPQGIVSLTGGMYGYGRALVADSFQLGDGNLLYAFEAFHEDGPWDVPEAYLRLNGILKYSDGNADQGWSVTSLDMHGDWNATNQVPQRAIDEGIIDTYGSLNPTDGGNTERYTLTAEGHQRDADGETKLQAYGAWYDMTLWNDFTYYLNNPVDGDQFEQNDQRFYGGVEGSHTFFGSLFGRSSDTTVGLQIRSDDIHTGLFNTEDRVQLSTVETDHVIESTAGVYVENRTQWADKFRTEGSLREDYFNFRVNSDIDGNSGNANAAQFSPKLNLVFGPWDETEFYASGGYGFHSNDARGIVSTVVPDSLLPAARVTPLTQALGGEVGVRTEIIHGLQSTLSLWLLDLKSEEVFDGDTAETVPSGPSRRIGIEFGNYYDVTKWLTVDADYSISQARFTDHEAAGDYVPESIGEVVQAGITFHDFPKLKKLYGAIRVRYFGPRALTQDDSVTSNSSTLINAELGYNFTPQLTLKADFLNLGNVKTDDIQYYYVSRLPGEPAAGVAGVVLHPAEPFEARFTLVYRF